MLKKFLSKLFTGLYVSSLLLTLVPQTALAAVGGYGFTYGDFDETAIIHREELTWYAGEEFIFNGYIDVVDPLPFSESFEILTPGADFETGGMMAVPVRGTPQIERLALGRTWPNPGNYTTSFCVIDVDTPRDCTDTPVRILAPTEGVHSVNVDVQDSVVDGQMDLTLPVGGGLVELPLDAALEDFIIGAGDVTISVSAPDALDASGTPFREFVSGGFSLTIPNTDSTPELGFTTIWGDTNGDKNLDLNLARILRAAGGLGALTPIYFNAPGSYPVTVCAQVKESNKCDTLNVNVISTEMNVALSTSMPSVEVGETLSFTTEITNIAEGTSTLFVNMNFDLATSTEDYPASIDVTGQDAYTLNFDTLYAETGVANPNICISTDLDAEPKCSSVPVTVIEDIPMSVAFQDEAMSVITGESFALSAFVDEIPEGASSLSYEILNLSESTFVGQSGTLDLEEGETVAFITLNDLVLAELGTHELELCVQNNFEVRTVCTSLTVEVLPEPLAITATLDAASVDPGTSVMASFSFENVNPASANLQTTIQWGDGVTSTVNTDPAVYAGETFALSHVYSEEGTYSIEICGNDGREDACQTQALIVEPALDVRLTLEQTAADEVAAHAVVSNLDADASVVPYTIDWGEGTVEAFSGLAEGSDTLNLSEAFLYAEPGVYTVEICVQEAAEVACDSKTISTLPVPLTLDVEDEGTQVFTNQAQTLSLNAAGIAPFAEAVRFSVSWGDSSPSEETVVAGADIVDGSYSLPITHAYTEAGTYFFEACANDGRGEVCMGSDVVVKMPLTLELTEPVINELSISVGSRIQGINADVSLLSFNYTWGDDSVTSFTQEVVPGEVVILNGEHTYAADGTYTAQLCVTDGDQEACQSLEVTVAASGIPGFTVTETGGNTQVSEDGDTDTFLVALVDKPQSNVVLQVTSGDVEEGTVSPATLTFTPENWDTAQTVTLTGVNDALEDGTQAYFLTVSVNDEASAAAFAELADQTVRAITTDNDGGTTGTGGGGGGGSGGGTRRDERPSLEDEDVELSSETPFTDLDETSPYFEAVMDLYGQGFVEGYEDGTFQAENITNRAEFMKLVVSAAGIEETTLSTYANCFPDVTTQWYAPYVCYGKEKGWIQGYPDGLFRPEQTVNRVEAIKMVVNVLELKLNIAFIMENPLFVDVEASAWYMPFVETAYSLGLINRPEDKLLYPADGMSRGALAELLSRALAL